MKKLILTLSLAIASYSSSFAQWSNGRDIYNTTNGNVGIGTISPTKRLTVFDTDAVGTAQLRLGFDDSYYWEMGRSATTGRFSIINKQNNTPSEFLSVLSTGNVGIGTTSPDENSQ